jgi:hypothetical protein
MTVCNNLFAKVTLTVAKEYNLIVGVSKTVIPSLGTLPTARLGELPNS